jgi:hypothetical protein
VRVGPALDRVWLELSEVQALLVAMNMISALLVSSFQERVNSDR